MRWAADLLELTAESAADTADLTAVALNAAAEAVALFEAVPAALHLRESADAVDAVCNAVPGTVSPVAYVPATLAAVASFAAAGDLAVQAAGLDATAHAVAVSTAPVTAADCALAGATDVSRLMVLAHLGVQSRSLLVPGRCNAHSCWLGCVYQG